MAAGAVCLTVVIMAAGTALPVMMVMLMRTVASRIMMMIVMMPVVLRRMGFRMNDRVRFHLLCPCQHSLRHLLELAVLRSEGDGPAHEINAHLLHTGNSAQRILQFCSTVGTVNIQ